MRLYEWRLSLSEYAECPTQASYTIENYYQLVMILIWPCPRGAKRPTGPALVLLNVIRRKGIEAIL
jgi:hypothetical protein